MQPSWTDITKEQKDISGTASTLRETRYEAHQPAKLTSNYWCHWPAGLVIVWSSQSHSGAEGDRIMEYLFPLTTLVVSFVGQSILVRREGPHLILLWLNMTSFVAG